MKVALFPGTFDPPTLGHLDLIQRGIPLCDKLYIGIGINTAKKGELFSIDERLEMVTLLTRSFPSVEVLPFSTLAIECAKKIKASFLIRGLRSFSDFESEKTMAFANKKLGIETVFLISAEKHAHISSTLIREIGQFKGRLLDYIPPEIEERVYNKLSS